ncbi:MAG TPA: beta-galactosidase [Roseiflexaceae bacterium]|nr:beta-galactosidase [Roseiflexaceae bacterium]HMP41680.1 beta-galactosidase [Roseiflexaceae bacterium]
MSVLSLLNQEPLLAAELHYFRTPRDDWEIMLARLRQLGATTVSTYVPWVWHAPHPEVIDLDGSSHPQRDLIGFVGLCARLGLHVLLKPGPFCDAELLGGGIPPWLLRQHPAIAALRPDGVPWRHSDSGMARICYLHPTYLAAAHSWISTFSAAVRHLQYPAGPIIALQVDNETPGDGMLPADIGLDPRLRLDYNPYVVETLWPRWCAGRSDLPAEPPRTWQPPTDVAALRHYTALNEFSDWFFAEAVATVAGWLRADGWQVPLFHDLLAAPWEAGSTIVDLPALARSTGWLSQNVYPEDVRSPFVGHEGYRYSFEEYVHFAFWRTRLTAHLSRGHPSFVAEISAAQDFFFLAPFIGGVQGACVYMATQLCPDQPQAGAFSRWAMEAPIRPDGSVRARFWHAKGIFMLCGALGADYAAATAPAKIALGYSHIPEHVAAWGYQLDYLQQGPAWQPPAELQQLVEGADHGTQSQLLAQQLVRANLAFDVIDLDSSTAEELARYALVLLPAPPLLARRTQQLLAGSETLALVGEARTLFDERLEACTILDAAEQQVAETGSLIRLIGDISGDQIADIVDSRESIARYGWPDAEDVDVTVRHGRLHAYVFIANRRAASYSGTIAYRTLDETVQHLHVNIGARRAAAVVVRGDEVIGVTVGGDASEGVWMIRGLSSSIVYNGGAGTVAPCERWVLFSAAHSGRFQMRRPEGWADMVAYRLLLSGRLLPAHYQTEVHHASLPYIAEDESGRTDLYLMAPRSAELPGHVRRYLATLLNARSAALERAAELAATSLPVDGHAILAAAQQACAAAAAGLADLAHSLADFASDSFTIDGYAALWNAADHRSAVLSETLAVALAHTRCAQLAGELPAAPAAAAVAVLAQLIEQIARAGLANDRE